MKDLPIIDTIVLDGIDKCGKNLLMGVLANLDRKYILVCRGLQSCIAYDRIYNREPVEYHPERHQNELFVFLEIEQDDWQIRCKLTNEPKIDFDQHSSVFDDVYLQLQEMGLKTLKVSSSHTSVIDMAKYILETANKINKLK